MPRKAAPKKAQPKTSKTPSKRGPKPEAQRNLAKKIVLKALQEGHSLSVACQDAGIWMSTFYIWRGNDAKFRQAAEKAMEAGWEEIHKEMQRRAIHGTRNDKWDKDGNKVGEELKYSDTLLIALGKYRNETFRRATSNSYAASVEEENNKGESRKITFKLGED